MIRQICTSLPLISIVTPSFNQAEFLEECIDSILSQTYPNIEYIIMDGGSTDGSVEIIKKYEKYLTYWQSCPDGGQYNALNEGFKKTSGEIMAWLNSDDKYHRDALFKVAYLFDSCPGIEWLSGRPTFFGGKGEITYIEPLLPRFCRKNFLKGQYNQPFIQQESTFWKRSLWDRAGGMLRTDFDLAGDLELWIRFFRYARLFSIDTSLGGYRGHGNQKAALHMERYITEAEKLMEDEKKSFHESYVPTSPEAPTPVKLDIRGYQEYLSRHGSLQCSPTLMAITEETVQYLLKDLAVLSQRDIQLQECEADRAARLDVIHKRDAQLIAQEEALTAQVRALQSRIKEMEDSFSWRITGALRAVHGRFFGRSR